MADRGSNGERMYTGVAVSPGVAHARVVLIGRIAREIPEHCITEEQVEEELKLLNKALVATRRDLKEVQHRVADAMGSSEAGIFEAHLLVLEDPALLSEVQKAIRTHRNNAAYSIAQVTGRYAEALAGMDDQYLRERAIDVRDVGGRILDHLAGRSIDTSLTGWTEPGILVAHDLTPGETALLDREKILGFATDVGGQTSHTAIMARKLGIPAIVGLTDITRSVRNGEYALLDAHTGTVIVNPTDQTLFAYGQLKQRRAQFEDRLQDLKDLPAITLDGHRITLAANIDHPADIHSVSSLGAEGVGLFRSEFLFLNRHDFPNEEEQYLSYRQVAESLAPAPVVFRTLDLGADKMPSSLFSDPEPNPFLGWRAIRICLDRADLFRTQLRAMLRANVHGNVRIMFPMISSLDELLAAKALLNECLEELQRQNIPCAYPAELGIMIEVPSAAIIADLLAAEVQFFSLGTNDLTGYTLAVDRLNERVAPLFTPAHPAILRLIHQTVDAAHRHSCWVGVCGEMAGEPSLVPLLLGLGVDELSATPRMVPSVKFLLRRIKLVEAQELAASALNIGSATEIRSRSLALARSVAPELFPQTHASSTA